MPSSAIDSAPIGAGLSEGRLQFISDLPSKDIAFIEQLKERQGRQNRGQVLEQLIETGRAVIQRQMT